MLTLKTPEGSSRSCDATLVYPLLTYWEDDIIPSRVDLGKSKYGGPFTIAQVEDVKTILRTAMTNVLSCFSWWYYDVAIVMS